MKHFKSHLILFTILFFIRQISISQDQTKTGKIIGLVSDIATQQPVIGATVSLEGTQVGTSTDTEGKYFLNNVRIGTYTMKISCVGYKPVNRTDIVVRSGHPTQINVQIEEEAVHIKNEVVVQGSFFSIPKEIPTSVYNMNYEEVRRQSGVIGDIHRIIQTMPGVVPTNDQRNDLVVRGGSPSENITIVDNVEVPNLSHFGAQGASGGPISMLNTELIHDANFLAGGFPAQYGGKLSSVLNVILREGNRENFAGTFDFSMAGAGLTFEGPFNTKGSWIITARRSYLDLLSGNYGMTAVPNYSNYQVKASYNLDPDNKIWFVSIGGTDKIKFDYDESKTDDPEIYNTISSGWRIISGLNWQHLFGKKGYGVLGISDDMDIFKQTANDPKLQNQLVFNNQSREGETTIKYDFVYNFESIGQLTAGFSNKFLRAHFEVSQPIGMYIPYSADSTRSHVFFLDNKVNTLQSSAYIQLSKSLFNNIDFSAGLRYDYFKFMNNKSTISPRLGIRYKLLSNLNLNASYGIFYQMPPLVFMDALPENRFMQPMRSDHYIAGFSYFPRPDMKITVEGYYKEYSHYPVSLEYPTYSLANAGDEYSIVGKVSTPFVSKGSGRSRGIELYIQKKLTDQLYGQISYSYSKTEHKALDGIFRSGSFDIPHVLSIIGGFKLNESWEFSSKFTYASGRPYTPVDIEASNRVGDNIFDVEHTNSKRLPDYNRLDIRADYRANFNGWCLVTYIDLENLYNRSNILTYYWNEKTHEPVALKQIAFFPVGGIIIEF